MKVYRTVVLIVLLVASCYGCTYQACDGSVIDLSSLTLPESLAYTASNDDFAYYFNICGATSLGDCSSDVASCQNTLFAPSSETAFNCGAASSQTITSCAESTVNECEVGDIVVHYGGGQTCTSTGTKRSTNIILRCSPLATQPNVVSISESSRCSYTILMETAVVCPAPSSSCSYTFENGSQVDLSGMTLPEGYNYVFDANEQTYLINVCGAASSTGCENSPVCQNTPGMDGVSCGSTATQSISADSDSNIILSYTGGQICAAYGPRNTTITVACDQSTSGYVSSVEEVSPCNYQINMKSLFACV